MDCLGVRAGVRNLLLPAADVVEVLPWSPCTPVPLTRSVLRGLCNVRGSLFSVLDLSVLLGGAAVPPHGDSRLLLLHAGRIRNTALAIDRLIGLHDPERLQAFANAAAPEAPLPTDAKPALAVSPAGRASPLADRCLSSLRADADGTLWQLLDLTVLLGSPEFLEVSDAGVGAGVST